MTDYSKLKVTELKAELKRRGIPQTGLKLKQNLIDRLLEADEEEQKKNLNVDVDATTQQTITHEDGGKENLAAEHHDTSVLPPEIQSSQREEPSLAIGNLGVDLERDTASKVLPRNPNTEHHVDDRTVIPESKAPTPERSVERESGDETLDPRSRTPGPAQERAATEPSAPLSLSQEPSTSRTSEGTDDLRKRKRRSQSPPPSPETTKKAKLDSDNSPILPKENMDVRRLSNHNHDTEMVGYSHSQTSGNEVTEVVAEPRHAGPMGDGMDIENDQGTQRAIELLSSGGAATSPTLEHDIRFKDARSLSSHNRDTEIVKYSKTSSDEVTEVVVEPGHVGLRKDGMDTEKSQGTQQASIEPTSGSGAAATSPTLNHDTQFKDARRLSSHNHDMEMVGYSQAPGDEVTEVVAEPGQEGPRRDVVDAENSQGIRRVSGAQEELPSGKAAAATSPTLKHDARFKELFSGTSRENVPPLSPQRDDIVNDDQDREVEPSLHPATSALYIRDFMRPLQLNSLKNHLIFLASSPESSPSAAVIRDLFLDSIKTHCLVGFANVSTALRVRSALHGAVWPNERTRKPLWVDFIPAEKLSDWIRIERESESRVRGGPRWEVVYEDFGDGIEAALREAPALSRPVNSTNIRGRDTGGNSLRAPLGPRGIVGAGPQRDSQGLGAPRHRAGDGFKALDDLFKFTTAKPKLYYLPVAQGVAHRRMNHFAALARKGPHPRRGGEEMRRYTFEDTDVIVDKGPEYANRTARGGRGRGGSSWRGR